MNFTTKKNKTVVISTANYQMLRVTEAYFSSLYNYRKWFNILFKINQLDVLEIYFFLSESFYYSITFKRNWRTYLFRYLINKISCPKPEFFNNFKSLLTEIQFEYSKAFLSLQKLPKNLPENSQDFGIQKVVFYCERAGSLMQNFVSIQLQFYLELLRENDGRSALSLKPKFIDENRYYNNYPFLIDEIMNFNRTLKIHFNQILKLRLKTLEIFFKGNSRTIAFIKSDNLKSVLRLPRSCNRPDVRLYHKRYLAALLLGTRGQ